MKRKPLSLFAKILSFILLILGFQSCLSGEGDEEGGEVMMYGTPTATYRVRGTVKASDTNQPVNGIRAVLVELYNGQEGIYSGDTIKVCADGAFDLKVRSGAMNGTNLRLKLTDIDGADNGLYNTKTQDIQFTNPALAGGEGWDKGTATKEIGDVKIDPLPTVNQ